MGGYYFSEDETARQALQAFSRMVSKDGTCLCRGDRDLEVVNLLGDACLVMDRLRRIVFLNDSAVEVLGASPEAVLGGLCEAIFGAGTPMRRCGLVEEGEGCCSSVVVEIAGGERTPFLKRQWVLRGPGGEVVGAVETLHRLRGFEAEVRCRTFEEDFRETADGMVCLDEHGLVLGVSLGVLRLLGQSREDVVGTPVGRWLCGGYPDLQRTLDAVRRTGQTAVVEQVRLGTDRGRESPTLLVRCLPRRAHGEGPVPMDLVLFRQQERGDEEERFGMVVASAAMRSVLQRVLTLSKKGVTVLLEGESGVGKEVVARAIHLAGPRAASPFYAFNCAALPEDLLESELFGYHRGAFTGAVRDKPGRLEACQDGTLLLDEVGCLSARLQAKLLRVLETREFERLGGTRPLRLRARILAATNSDLHAMVKEGAFRADLYYRLKVVPLRIPPLRDRPEDILPLARRFARTEEDGMPDGRCPRFTEEAIAALQEYSWPGNVRELRNAIRYALAMGNGTVIGLCDLPPEVVRGPRRTTSPEGDVDRIRETLAACRYNHTAAARRLGISRTTLWRRMKDLGLLES